MQLLALLLVPAFIGLVTSQQVHPNYPDKGFAPGGRSNNHRFPDPFPNAPQHAPQGNQGGNNVNHQNVGVLPQGNGGSSRGFVPDYAPVAPGPVSNNVNHVQAGSVPPPGGSSRQTDAPLGPVQRGMVDQVNMVNAGAAPIGGNQNSGEYVDYAYGGAAANNAPAAAGGGNSGAGGNNQVAYAAGGNSGNGGPAYAAGPFSDNAGAAAPLGGATINDLTQQEAGKAQHVTKGAGMGTTVAGVVVAVLVLVGIVGVAAVFLVRQRQNRMTLSSV